MKLNQIVSHIVMDEYEIRVRKSFLILPRWDGFRFRWMEYVTVIERRIYADPIYCFIWEELGIY